MRLSDRKFATRAATLGLFACGLAACGAGSTDGLSAASVERGKLASSGPRANGPAADYPVVIGEPYIIDGVTYTPSDVWNYDEVGSVTMDRDGGTAISGSHHTLPVPSYVEVTSLDTGKTILVRLERRGPTNSNALIALSPGAIEQLGASPTTSVRVRRVNPQEIERAALRSGQRVPERMETPMSLVNVLRLKLPGGGGAAPVASPAPAAVAAVPKQGLALPPLDSGSAAVAVAPPKQVAPKPAPRPITAVPTTANGAFVVQAGAFSTKDRADRVAKAVGGNVSKVGNLFRVRVGPYGTRKLAEASLAKVRAAGYSDARIY